MDDWDDDQDPSADFGDAGDAGDGGDSGEWGAGTEALTYAQTTITVSHRGEVLLADNDIAGVLDAYGVGDDGTAYA